MENNKVNELNLCIAMIYYIISIMPEERLNLEEIVRILDNEMNIVEKNIVQFPTGHLAKMYYDKLSNLSKEEFDNVVTDLKNKIIKCKDDIIFQNAIMILSSDEQVIGLANCIIEYKGYNSTEKIDINEKKSENNKKTILKFFRNYSIEDEETAQLITYDKTEKDFYIEKDKILNIEGNNCNTKITIKNISDEFVELEIEDSNILTMESINAGVVNIKIEKGKMYEYYLPSAYALTIEIMEETMDKNIKELTIQNGNYIDEETIKIKRIDGALKGYYNQRKNMISKEPIEENMFFDISKEETQKLYDLIQRIDFDSNICSDDYLEGGTAGRIVILYEDGNTYSKEFGAYIPNDIAELYKAIKLLCSNEIEEEKSLQIVFGYPISEHIIENVGMVCQDNPEYKSFFEEQKKYIIEEMTEAKDIATINGRKISEYLATIKNSEEFYNIVVAMGESSIYNINYNFKDNKMVYSIEIDNLGLFRSVLIYYIIGIVYYWTAERTPITIEITIDKKFEEIFDTIRPMLNVVQRMIKGIEEFKILYK